MHVQDLGVLKKKCLERKEKTDWALSKKQLAR